MSSKEAAKLFIYFKEDTKSNWLTKSRLWQKFEIQFSLCLPWKIDSFTQLFIMFATFVPPPFFRNPLYTFFFYKNIWQWLRLEVFLTFENFSLILVLFLFLIFGNRGWMFLNFDLEYFGYWAREVKFWSDIPKWCQV